MLYTDKSIRFADSEIAAYRAEGVDVTQITTYRQFVQIVNRQRQNRRKEKEKMAKRFRRKALNGSMEYFDTYDELIVAQRKDVACIQSVSFGIIGLIAGGILAYALLRWIHVDSRMIRFVAVIAGAWAGGIFGANLSALIWTILKWVLIFTMVAATCLLIFMVI